MNELKFDSQQSGSANTTIIKISGDIDAYHSPKLKEKMEETVKGGFKTIILEFSEVPYIDSAGLGTLVSVLREIRNYQKELKLVGLRKNIKRIFEMTRLDNIFNIYDTIEEAEK